MKIEFTITKRVPNPKYTNDYGKEPKEIEYSLEVHLEGDANLMTTLFKKIEEASTENKWSL